MAVQIETRRLVRGACSHDCPDNCAWKVTVEGGRAVDLKGDEDHPFTRGGLCAKVNHYLEDRVYHPDRLLRPLRRVGAKGSADFEPVGWDEALDAVASKLRRILDDDGAASVLPYSYMGTQGMIQGASLDRRFFARMGATRLERTVCGSTSGTGIASVIGSPLGIVPEEIVHSRFVVLWGTNTVVTNLHLWPFVRQAQKAGAKVVVIDPASTRTAARADWHVRPLPGTDAALALGMMHVIVRDGLEDREYIEKHTVGYRRLCERLEEYPPERVAAIAGVEAEEIVELARAYATTRPATIRTLVGMEHHAHGGMTLRSIACLPALVGAWRDRGGGLLHMTVSLFVEALDSRALTMSELEDSTIRSVNMVQLGRALTDTTLDPPIRALVVYNSNPAAIAPNQNLVLEGLRREDLFTVVVEHFLTDTARYADFVFPATTQLEHLDLHWSWGHTYLALNRPAIEPCGEAVPNTEFFRRLARRLGFDEPYLQDTDEELIRTALGTGHPHLEGITYERLQEKGWLPLNLSRDERPFAHAEKGGFPTRSGRCELYSEALAQAGLDPLPAYQPAAESPSTDGPLARRYPLILITPKSSLRFLNSSYANVPRQVKAEGEPRLDIHPDDARRRRIEDGDWVRVHNDRGAVEIAAAVRDTIRPGVVLMPSGWWASLSGGSSANALTADGISDLGRGGDFHDTLVEVARLGE